MDRNTIGIVALIIAGLACGSAYANWEVVETSAEIVRADETKAAAELGPARAAAVGHIDSDGVIDLVVGHAVGEAGAIAVYFGNEAFRQGIKREMDRAARGEAPADPFRSEAILFDLPFAPDWVAVGDFDADGARDVACSARGRSELVWLAGDGRGALGAPKSIALPGSATAMISGEVNRRDAMTDIVVAVDAATGAGLLVFEHPVGAFAAEPEWHSLAAPATDLALGRLDGDSWIDIAAAASDLVVVFGRDRKLGLTRRQQAEVHPAAISSIELGAPVHDLVAGEYTGVDHHEQLAVRRTDGVIELVSFVERSFESVEIGLFDPPARNETPLVAADIAYGARTDLIARSAVGAELEVFDLPAVKSGVVRLEPQGAVGAEAHLIVPARLNRDARDDLIFFSGREAPAVVKTFNRVSYVVNSAADPGTGGCDTSECTLREAILAVNAGGAPADIIFDLGVHAEIAPTSPLPYSTEAGVAIDGTVGTHPFFTPLTLAGQSCIGSCQGLVISGDATLGGQHTLTDLAFVNWGGDALVLDSRSNTVEGCRFGLSGDYTPAGNDAGGVFVGENSNTIGGSTTAARNVVSANNLYGIKIAPVDNDEVYSTEVLGNFIGTDAGGNTAVPNWVGVVMISNNGSTIGAGLGVGGGGNVIAGNLNDGLFSNGTVDYYSDDLLVVGNHVGVGFDGVTPLGNGGPGLSLLRTAHMTAGGSTPGTRNVIGDNSTGVSVSAGNGIGHVIRGNFVGLGSDGATPIGNQTGIGIQSNNITVGGDSPGLGNTICASSVHGIEVVNTHSVEVMGNTVGTNADGDPGLGNSSTGIMIENSNSCLIGEDGNPDAENFVMASGEYGIWFSGGMSHIAQNNHIGLPGDPAMGTVGSGIQVEGCSGCWVIDNAVSDSGNDGVTVYGSSATMVWVVGNTISDSGDLAIDLDDDGVTANDPGDVDAGPNDLQNFPVLTGADPLTGLVSGTLDTNVGVGAYTIELYQSQTCNPSGHGEAEVYVGSAVVTTDATGHGEFSQTVGGLTDGWYLTALAVDADRNTSELSACIEVETIAPQEITLEFVDGFLSISEGEPMAEIDIVMTTSDGEVSEAASSVDYETYDDGAVAGQDYVSASGTMLFPAGTASGTIQTVEVDLIDDVLVELNEDFVVEITNPTGAVLGSQIEFPVTILDNDAEPPIFADDFESGDTSVWSSTIP